MRIPPAELPDDAPVRNNLVRATGTNPDMHRGFASLAGRVHSASRLPVRTRELAVLRIAGRLRSAYQLQAHEPAARGVGLSEAEISAARDGDVTAFGGADAACLALADAVETGTVDDVQWEASREWYSDDELMDLVMLVAFYGLACRVALAVAVDLEPE